MSDRKDYIRVVHTSTMRGDIDLVAVERAVNGEVPEYMTPEEKRAAVDVLVSNNVGVKEISERLGIRPALLAQWVPPVPKRLGEPKCGTVRGYRLHHRNGEKACTPCRTANSTVDRARRSFQPIPEELVA